MTTWYSTRSPYKLHCFVSRKQLLVNVDNTFYCIKSGVRVAVKQRVLGVFNDSKFELDVGMFKRGFPSDR